MRSLTSSSALGNGERVVTTAVDGGVAFGFETDVPMSRATRLVEWRNDTVLAAAVFADGSQFSAIQATPPPAPIGGQWWIEDIAGAPVMFVRFGAANVAIAAPNGATTGVSSITAGSGSGILASASSGPVVLSIDFGEVAAAVHTHDYLPLDGSGTMGGQLELIDGTAAAPAAHGTVATTGLFFDGGVGMAVGGAQVGKFTATGLTLGAYEIPYALGAVGTVVRRSATGVGWSRVAHADLSAVGANDHHAQVHGMTADHQATGWRLFYSNATGAIIELPLGAANKALFSAGAAAAPQWRDAQATPARSDPVTAIAYRFSDDVASGFTVDTLGHAFVVVNGDVLLDIAADGFKVGVAAAGITLPTVRGTVGQVLTQQADGVVGFAAAAGANSDTTPYYRAFMFGR